jgi:hypothetical protein
MNEPYQHIIRKEKIELKLRNADRRAFDYRKRIERLMLEEINPGIEKIFNRLNKNERKYFDKIEIDMGIISTENCERDFKEKFFPALENKIEELLHKDKEEFFTEADKLNNDHSLSAAFFFFLENSFLPWWFPVADFAAWENELTESFAKENISKKVFKKILENEPQLKRFIYQFSEKLISNFIASAETALVGFDIFLFEKKVCDILLYHEKSEEKKNKFRMLFFRNAFKIIEKKETITIEQFKKQLLEKVVENRMVNLNEDYFKDILKENSNKFGEDELNTDQTKEELQTRKKIKEEESLYIANCGLVILHPFIPQLFQTLELLDENKKLREELWSRALQLLQFLATGETASHEYDLLLNKILCGIPVDAPVESNVELTETEKNEAIILLQSVIQHWKILKNTSVEGLQQTFLQRQGKLSQTDTGWVLRAEQKTLDILMNQLPWGIGTIKLPWMNYFLNVEWC